MPRQNDGDVASGPPPTDSVGGELEEILTLAQISVDVQQRICYGELTATGCCVGLQVTNSSLHPFPPSLTMSTKRQRSASDASDAPATTPPASPPRPAKRPRPDNNNNNNPVTVLVLDSDTTHKHFQVYLGIQNTVSAIALSGKRVVRVLHRDTDTDEEDEADEAKDDAPGPGPGPGPCPCQSQMDIGCAYPLHRESRTCCRNQGEVATIQWAPAKGTSDLTKVLHAIRQHYDDCAYVLVHLPQDTRFSDARDHMLRNHADAYIVCSPTEPQLRDVAKVLATRADGDKAARPTPRFLATLGTLDAVKDAGLKETLPSLRELHTTDSIQCFIRAMDAVADDRGVEEGEI